MAAEGLQRVLLPAAEIAATVDRLAGEISRDCARLDGGLLVIGLLKGAFVFMADLVRRLDFPVETEFMAVESYGSGTVSSGRPAMRMDVGADVAGRHLLIVEDIVDTGRTLTVVREHLRRRGPASLRTVTLLDKPVRRAVEVRVDYVGREIPDLFVCGYGLDFAGKYRNLPYIGVLGK